MSSWTVADHYAAVKEGWLVTPRNEIEWCYSAQTRKRKNLLVPPQQYVAELAKEGDVLAAKAISYVAYKRLVR